MEVERLFRGSPLGVIVIDDRIGAASALKMAYAARTKGTTALLATILAMAEREGVIGGYTYYFGPATEEDPIEVKLYGKDYGALELLPVGAKVEVVYFDPGGGRIRGHQGCNDGRHPRRLPRLRRDPRS